MVKLKLLLILGQLVGVVWLPTSETIRTNNKQEYNMCISEMVNRDSYLNVCVERGEVWIEDGISYLMKLDTPYSQDIEISIAKEMCQILNQCKNKDLQLGEGHYGYPEINLD